jgi:hypothetical protein
MESFKAKGSYLVECFRDGKLAWSENIDNIIVTEGRNHILDVTYHAAAQITTWYLCPFEGNYTPVAGDTAATFPASSTECTAYDEAARVAFVETAPSAGSLSNVGNVAVFTMNASKTLYGVSLSSVSTKSATTGTLMSASRFAAPRAVVDNDVVQITYTINVTSS